MAGEFRNAPSQSRAPSTRYTDIFESATLSFRIRLSSTRIQRIRMHAIP